MLTNILQYIFRSFLTEQQINTIVQTLPIAFLLGRLRMFARVVLIDFLLSCTRIEIFVDVL